MNMHATFFDDTYERSEDETKTIACSAIWAQFSSSDAYRSLRTVREKTEYGRDELYDWLTDNVGVEVHRKIKKIRGWQKRPKENDGDGSDDDDDNAGHSPRQGPKT
jgi:hypothetical protein